MAQGGVNMQGLAQAAALHARMGAISSPPNVFQVASPEQVAQNQNVAFPAQLGSTDPDDEKYALRQKIVGAGRGDSAVVPGVGQAIAGEEFFDYAKRKMDQDTSFQFQTWIMEQAELDAPEKAAWWFSKFPWMRDLRYQYIDQQAELQKKMAKIAVSGAQSEEDFLILFMNERGLLKVADTPLHRLGESSVGAKTYQAGFFSPLSKPQFQPFQPYGPAQKIPFNQPLAPITSWGDGAAPFVIRGWPTRTSLSSLWNPSNVGGGRIG